MRRSPRRDLVAPGRRPTPWTPSAEWRRHAPEACGLPDRVAALRRAYGVAAEKRIWQILFPGPGFPGPGSLIQGGGLFSGLHAAAELAHLAPRLRWYERARAHVGEAYTPARRRERRHLDALLALLRRDQARARRQVARAKLNPTRPWGVPIATLDGTLLVNVGPMQRQMKRWAGLGDRAAALAQYLSTIIRPRRRRRTPVSRGVPHPYTVEVLTLTADLLALAYPFLPPLTAADVKTRIAHRRPRSLK